MLRYLGPLVAATLLAAPVAAHTDILPAEALAMMLADPDLVVLDVREYYEFCGSRQHIDDAANLPWNSGVLQSRFGELPLDVDIVVVCGSGGRSHLAATYLDGQGFAHVYDMLGGMGAWSWETEACDATPGLTLAGTPAGTEIDWTPVSGTQDYDLIRGEVDNIANAGTYIDLGPSVCLGHATPFTYYTDAEPSDGLRFFLARQVQGSWGESSDNTPRSPVSVDCGAD